MLARSEDAAQKTEAQRLPSIRTLPTWFVCLRALASPPAGVQQAGRAEGGVSRGAGRRARAGSKVAAIR